MSETHFPLDESKLPFSIPKDAQPREKILKLGRMITDRIPAKLHGLTAEDPEYWGLAGVVTDEMADVALKMKVRKPMTLSELVKATGKPAEELEPLLYQMSCVGLLEYNWENERHEKQYVLPMFVPGSAEFFNMHKQQIQDNPEVTAFFERMTFLPLEQIDEMDKWEGSQLNTAKEILAYELTKLVHGQEEAEKAQSAARAIFGGGGDTADMPCTCLCREDAQGDSIGLLDLMVKCKLAPSKKEARRLVEQGGVEVNGEKVTDVSAAFPCTAFCGEGLVIKKGKKVFHKVIMDQ